MKRLAISELVRLAVRQAMLDAWNDICSDTGCHPLDIERRGQQIFFSPQHWADATAMFIEPLLADSFTARVKELEALINTPETEDFMKAVPLEAAHQVERWGAGHDKQKTVWDWYWTLGYLGGKCAQAMLAGDLTKAKHHTITIAAFALNWHRHLKGGG